MLTEFRDRKVPVGKGKFIIVPRGLEHRQAADQEVHVVVFEPAPTLNTETCRNELTLRELQRV